MTATGLLLAAGAGRRMGRPKALVRTADGVSFLDHAVRTLLDAGCPRVTVVLGAAEREARDLLDGLGWGADERVRAVVAVDWAEGMGASLRTGLGALADIEPTTTSCVVSLVDLPDVGVDVVRRVLASGDGEDVLARATYERRPGHPVLLGRAHWAGVAEVAHGDRGARDYLATHDVAGVECGDLATGHDVDTATPD